MSEKDKLILTAGPSITDKEIKYVTDAVRNGWNENWNSYLVPFEEAFAKYVGVKYALALSSCTGAMHLSLMALGVGEGDEVIVPDLAWVATANAVKYVGAEPVFVDVQEDTWCMDPKLVKEAITDKTKAIIPVHLYGHPCDMDEINKIAQDHNFSIMEDAAQAIGSTYKGKRMGSWGDVACFSFHGAKIMVTGEGGMLVTDSKDIYDKARFYNDHCRDPKGTFWIYEVGYKYKMSNIQAALGLAQIERMDELVAKKCQVFQWYHDRLGDVDGLNLNAQAKDVKNNYWMSCIVLNGEFAVTRDELMKELKEKYKVDNRTFFYPISEFEPYEKRFENPISKKLSSFGINLPSGYPLTEDQVDHICKGIRETLKV